MEKLLALAEQCTPFKTVTIRPHDLPRITSDVRKRMRNEIGYLGYLENTSVTIVEIHIIGLYGQEMMLQTCSINLSKLCSIPCK